MAGYYGYSKSNNAIFAEENEIYPLSTAIKVVAKSAGVTQKVARETLLMFGACEYHHTSKRFNRTDYYCTKTAFNYLKSAPIRAILDAGGYKAAFKQALSSQDFNVRSQNRKELCDKITKETGATTSDILNWYYRTYSPDDMS